MASDYYYRSNGRVSGPVSAKHLRFLALYGRLSPDDEVRKEGSEEWVLARSITNLFPQALPVGPAPAARVVAPPPAPPPGPPAPSPAPSDSGPAAPPRWRESSFRWRNLPSRVASRLRPRPAWGRWLRALRPYRLHIALGAAGLILVLTTVVLVYGAAAHREHEDLAATPPPAPKPAGPEPGPPPKTPPAPTGRADSPPDAQGTERDTGTARAAPRPKEADPPPKPAPKGALTREEIAAKCEGAVALIRGKSSAGTGFLVGPGLLATNAHVIGGERPDDLQVHFPAAMADKVPLRARLLYEDKARDLAFLSLTTSLRPLDVAKAYRFRRGQEVTVIGNPGLGGKVILEVAVSPGTMSTTTRLDGLDFYQLSTSINPGNSGGPVLDSAGEVIGVMTAKAAREEGIAFCIPADALQAAMTRVAAQTDADRSRAGSRHRLELVLVRLVAGRFFYAKSIDLYADALRDGKLAARQAELAGDFQIVERAVFDGLDEVLAELADDTLLAGDLRKNVAALSKTSQALKAHAVNPRGAPAAYRKKGEELRQEHEKLTRAVLADYDLPYSLTAHFGPVEVTIKGK